MMARWGFWLPMFLVVACGKTVAKLDYAQVGDRREAPLSVSPGDKLGFSMHIDRYSYEGANYVMLDIELVKDGAIVHTHSCGGFELEGYRGGGTGATESHGWCSVTAPASGADTIRVGTRFQTKATATIEGLQVRIQK
jgi:hypothetical protein